ncbi:MAG TPA: hypothetical protein VNE61_03915 [Ktedonobacteraceae bacterium]|nr:hypothetical protein [Ktedonobacteraceae bacterium]
MTAQCITPVGTGAINRPLLAQCVAPPHFICFLSRDEFELLNAQRARQETQLIRLGIFAPALEVG